MNKFVVEKMYLYMVNYFSNVQSQPTGIFRHVSLTLMLPIQSTLSRQLLQKNRRKNLVFLNEELFQESLNSRTFSHLSSLVFSVIIGQCIDGLSCGAAALAASPAV